ncbi:NADPH-dependent FMN reductase [Persicirhabdus sediminis]|uniref:NAD(P)H-dependent oxidoreductase n=1 Tax=Persicirhabdus sediminis TaxID=454144 RepID=A0A8J7MFW0_9BACT|nr:NAD(P)H-dependent oxidoreductase [Persicirhabdus sediminis]MBK1792065.1 NAD(P)H-dependent oxidoreductase [Persicirhabdus sediminis]
MQSICIIATSLNEESKSQVLAREFASRAELAKIPTELIDLRQLELPFAGSAASWESADAAKLKAAVEKASHIVFAVPIYCYDVNAAAKNIIELLGQTFSKKVVSFICAAGGSSSYMSVMGMANHLMLDFRSIIVPRFLYVESSSWQDDGSLPAEIDERMNQLLEDMREIHIIPNS